MSQALNENRKFFVDLQLAKDFCNINDRSKEDIMELQKSVECPELSGVPVDVAARYSEGFPIYFVDVPPTSKASECELRALLSELANALPDGWWQRNHYYQRIQNGLRTECGTLRNLRLKLAEYEKVAAFVPADDRIKPAAL